MKQYLLFFIALAFANDFNLSDEFYKNKGGTMQSLYLIPDTEESYLVKDYREKLRGDTLKLKGNLESLGLLI